MRAHSKSGGVGEELIIGLLCRIVLSLLLLGELPLGLQRVVVPPLPLVHGLVLAGHVLPQGREVGAEDLTKLLLFGLRKQLRECVSVCVYVRGLFPAHKFRNFRPSKRPIT